MDPCGGARICAMEPPVGKRLPSRVKLDYQSRALAREWYLASGKDLIVVEVRDTRLVLVYRLSPLSHDVLVYSIVLGVSFPVSHNGTLCTCTL
jgi:hypothetical protein